MNVIDALVLAAPYFKRIYPQDIMIGITDKEVFQYYERSEKVDFGIGKGSPIPLEDPTLRNALNGQPSTNRISADLYGYIVVSSAVPIYGDNEEIVGIFAIAYTLENEEKLEQLTSDIESISNQLVNMVQSVAAQSQQLSASSSQILDNTRKAVADSEQVNEVTSFIRQISDQTNLLGLNAAIEAARVGELGAGFGVVATEVRKLSVNTKEATTNIQSALNNVQQSIKQMENEIESIAASSNAQAELVNHFSEAIERLNAASGEMNTFIRSIMNGNNIK